MTGRHTRRARWEVVMRIHTSGNGDQPALTWIAPASVGRRLRRSRYTAWRHARRLTRREDPDWGPMARGIRTTWEHRRART